MPRIIKQFGKLLCLIIFSILILDAILVLGLPKWKREIPHADAAVVLGAAINSPALYNRTLEALSLNRQGKIDKLILSGGRISSLDISEAGYMKKVLQSNSSALPPIIMDESAGNTWENLNNARKLAPEVKSIVVVSDEFHLARGVLTALRAGFYPVYWASPETTHYSKEELRWYYAREYIAMLAYLPRFIKGE